jgi:hypothetical protein
VATGLPVPIRFELPPGWQLVHPDDIGVPEAAHAAVLAETLGSAAQSVFEKLRRVYVTSAPM